MPPQLVYPTPSRTPCPSPSQYHNHPPSPRYHFLAPKLVRAFFVSLPSVSLSSGPAAFFLLLFFSAPVLPPPPPALLGVGAPDGPSRPPPKVLDIGVGAGVEPGVCESWLREAVSSVMPCQPAQHGPETRQMETRKGSKRTYCCRRVIRHRAPREDAVLVRQPRLPPLRDRRVGPLDVVVEPDHDVPAGRCLEIVRLLGCNVLFGRCLFSVVDRQRSAFPGGGALCGAMAQRTSFFSSALRRPINSLRCCLCFS